MNYEITYTNNKNAYAKIRDGKLIISIPKILKYNKKLENTLIQKWQQMLEKHKKYDHIKTQTTNDVVLFWETVSKTEFKWDLNKNLKNILLEYVQPLVDEYSQKLWYKYSKISVRKVKTKRWSCSSDQQIMFNLSLVHLPTRYIKYVVIHEVCHLKHKNHSKDFWSQVEWFLPDYKEIRREMKKMIIE